MRLLTKHSRYILLANLFILLLGGVLFFYLFNYILNRNIEKTLQERKTFALNRLAHSDSLYIYQRFSANVFSIKRLPERVRSHEQMKDTLFFDPIENQPSLFRQLTIVETLRGQTFQITVRRPLIDRNEIVQGILALLLLLILGLFIALYFANRLVSSRLWLPFKATLAQLRTIQIDELAAVPFPATNITEFRELHQALHRLLERIQEDYYALKEYTENTTHEIQTPLAIIRSKLELLQEESLTLEQLQLVNGANQAVSRLARLKEALLLLVRIKNRQYVKHEPLQIAPLLRFRLAYFEELMQLGQLSLKARIEEEVIVLMHPVLAEILLDNLISNAIKHNISEGSVQVELAKSQLTVRNSGQKPSLPTTAFFDRFTKSDPKSKSLGLGLAIVKAICETNRLQIDYQFAEDHHEVRVVFPTTESLQNALV